MLFSRILYMICVNGGCLVSEIFNTIDRKTWREIKETSQWPPMENQLVVYTHNSRSYECNYTRIGPSAWGETSPGDRY